VKDSSWVKRYAHAAYQHNTRNRLMNLAVGGYTTWHIMPTGTVVPSGLPFTVDSVRNITAALALQPYAIIINMPSNDASYQVTVARQLLNYATIAGEAANSGVKLWVSTTQPRNFSSATQLQIQHDMADSIQAIFGSYAIDFWNGLADTSGHILGKYDSGDGIHLNNAGHKLLAERVIAKGIDTVYCMTTSIQESTPMDLHYHPTLFPNPFDDHFTLTFATSSSGEIRLMLYDMAGRVIAQTDEKVHAAGIHQIQWSPDISGATTHQFMLCTITIHDVLGDYTKTLKVFRF
jgi:lysophospholipase L1-like esterase